jgi:hypothetical protein
MPAILRNLPFYDDFTTVEVQGRGYRILPRQIIVWVSLGFKGLKSLGAGTPRFPAVLDIGFTDNFLIHQQLLRGFAGLEPEHLRRLDERLRAHERQIPLHAANTWIHPNRPGERDRFRDVAPFLLELHRGIGVPTGTDLYPRLPLLGARALRGAGLRLFVDYNRCLVDLTTPRRFWPFG